AQLEAAGVRQHDVEEEQIAVLHAEQVERLAPGRRGYHSVTVGAQVVREELARRLVVFHQHDRLGLRQAGTPLFEAARPPGSIGHRVKFGAAWSYADRGVSAACARSEEGS